jgi:hypothetical protein
MITYPLLNEIAEFLDLLNQIRGLSFASRIREVIVDLVSLPSAGVKVCCQAGYGSPHCNFECLKSCQMVPRTGDTVTGTGDHHFRELEGGIVRGRKTAVRRQCLYAGILQVTLDDVP